MANKQGLVVLITIKTSASFNRGGLQLQVRHTKQEVLNILFEGLRRLEYRGYDSAGVSVDLPVEVGSVSS